MKQQQSTWMLIDYPDSKEAVIKAATESLTYHWWYRNSHLEQALAASPLWVKIPEHSDTFSSHFSKAPVFTTTTTDEDFKQHVKSLLLMRGPNKKPYLLRFYEPKYLTLWLSQLTDNRLTSLLGPITSVEWQYADKTHHIENPTPKVAIEPHDIAWFQLTDSDWEQLKSAFNQQ